MEDQGGTALSNRRLRVLAGHLAPPAGRPAVPRSCAAEEGKAECPRDSRRQRTAVKGSIPKRRQEVIKWNGWGYEGTELVVENGNLKFHGGERYLVGDIEMTDHFKDWVKSVLNMTLEDTKTKFEQNHMPKRYPSSIINQEFYQWVMDLGVQHSLDGDDRLVRAHGQTLHEIALLRGIPWCINGLAKGSKLEPLAPFPRIPDLVVWPEKHDDVVKLVKAADEMNVVLIPFGGGTNVTEAVVCSPDEDRMIVSLDTSQMNHILWVDHTSLLACVESGIIGQDLEREMNARGLTIGHEPDSYEFSSLGGWVATRASGMKKNKYGNIEDILVHVKMVSPNGVLQKNCQAPRMSCGPDLHNIILGSEGTLGVVTEVVIKVRPLPECKEYGSIVFENLESGINFMWEIARERCQPASLRLIDNEQYKSGHFLKERVGMLGAFLDFTKMMYLRKIKGIDTDVMSIAILIFEGSCEEVRQQQKKVYSIAVNKFGGILSGQGNGQRGYKLTFAIAYLRDFCLTHGILGDSFETSVPWEKTLSLCQNVKYRVAQECKARGIKYFLISCRVTQVYDAGSCVYFYFVFNGRELIKNMGPGKTVDPFEVFHEIEERARDEILASGGSISHHHGIGQIRRQWFANQVSKPGVDVYRAVKKQLDPHNIFAVQNIDFQPANNSCQPKHSYDSINHFIDIGKN